MKKNIGVVLLFLLLCSLLACFISIGDKAANVSIIYAATAVLSLATAVGYRLLIKKRDPWFVLLFASVLVVNSGYLALSLSGTLNAALWANRLSYLGSVFLPLSMLMIILNTCRLKYQKYLPKILLGISTVIFLISASPGILDVYYEEVSLTTVNGTTVLDKDYGPLHCIYLFYLLGYFLATAIVLFHACAKRNVDSAIHAVVMSAALFVNIGVWLLEQFVRIDFELLSVSYIVSELFLLLLCLLLQREDEFKTQQVHAPAQKQTDVSSATQPEQPAAKTIEEQCAYFAAQLISLTPTERIIYDFYLEGKTTKEIMAELNIKENTLKYHNKNIYGKLGVSSRKQLVSIASTLKRNA